MKKKFSFILVSTLFLCTCSTQQGTVPKIQNPIFQVEKNTIYDYSLDTQLESLSEQIVNSMTESAKQKVAVIEFSDLGGNVSEFGKYLSEELITRLFITKKFEVIERRLLNKVLDEQNLSVSDLIDPNSIMELGKILGVDAIVSGTITDLGTSLKINARLISTETGSVFAVAAGEINKDKSIEKLMNKSFITKDTEKPTEKKFSETKETPIEKVVSEKSSTFYMEDFSEVEEGTIPEGWLGAEKLIVKKRGVQKYLTRFGSGSARILISNVKFPSNFRLNMEIKLYTASYYGSSYSPNNCKIIIGNLPYVRIGTGFFYDNNYIRISEVTAEGWDIAKLKESATISIVKKGQVVKIFLNDEQKIIFRHSENFIPPSEFIIDFTDCWGIELFKIVGTNLGD